MNLDSCMMVVLYLFAGLVFLVGLISKAWGLILVGGCALLFLFLGQDPLNFTEK